MKFEWDQRKSKENLVKYGVSFDEASTLLGDMLAATMPDPDHSLLELRFISIGHSSMGRLLVMIHTESAEVIRIISAREASSTERKTMNQETENNFNDEMRAEYDFSGAVRGKYYQRYTEGTNIIILDPDIAAAFKNSASVNQALRLLLDLAKQQAPHSS